MAAADEDEPGIGAGLREIGALREEAVTRVHAVGFRGLGSGDQFVDRQIAFGRGRRADCARLVAQPHMQRIAVGVRIDRDGAQTQATRRARDADCNLAAIGDEHGGEHGAPGLLRRLS